MDILTWISLAIVASAVVAVPALIGMRARMTAALERERRAYADALAAHERERQAVEDRIRAAEEHVRREALDEFIRDLRVEERSRVRQSSSMFSARRVIVHEERLCFRDQPLSNWVEQEVIVEEGAENAPKPQPVFLAPHADSCSVPAVNHNLPVTSS
jgi:hypothetical protein